MRRTAWYTYTPPANQRLIAHTFGSTYDTVLAVFRAGNPDTLANLTLVICNDHAYTAGAPHSQAVFNATAGTRYYFQIGHVKGGVFALEFRLGVLGNAALIVNGTKVPVVNRTHMELALRRSPLWSHAVIVQLAEPTLAQLQAAIRETYDAVPADAVSLFVFSGHGSKTRGPGERGARGPLVDNDPVDEGGAGNDGADEVIHLSPGAAVEDDDLGALFAGVRGRRVLVFDSCYSGGLIDGASDFAERPGGVLLLSSQPNQASTFSSDEVVKWGPPTDRHAHSWFPGSLITGISRAGAAHVAEADGADGTLPNGLVTVHEWFTFADQAVAQIRATWNGRHPTLVEDMDPLIDESRAPAGAGARDIVIFSYELSPDELPDPALLLHPGPAVVAPRQLTLLLQQGDDDTIHSPQCDACCRDLGDAPDPLTDTPGQYPTKLASGGALHENISEDSDCPVCGNSTRLSLEWLGTNIDNEADGDPERDGVDSDADGLDGDADDDGVTFHTNASSLEIDVGVSVLDRNIAAPDGTPGYDRNDPLKRLYLNAWADWNRDGVWSPSEKIIGDAAGDFPVDPRTDPQFADDNKASYRFNVTVPATAAAGEIYFRFRLDYGEDVGQIQSVDATLQQEKGTAQFGEVEDYCITLVPLFAGLSPPLEDSAGTLTLSGDLVTTRMFAWQSTDSVLGAIAIDNVPARTWNYSRAVGEKPARLVFVGGRGDTTIYGDVLFAPYNRAVVDVVKSSRRVRYLLKSGDCPIPEGRISQE